VIAGVAEETTNPGARLVILEPDRAPFVEKGYEIKVNSNEIKLRALDDIDQNYQALGQSLSNAANFSVRDPISGNNLDFNVVVNESGLVIQPLNQEAASFTNAQRTPAIGGAVRSAVSDLGFDVEAFTTIFIDFTNVQP
jgi:hypothetical protein